MKVISREDRRLEFDLINVDAPIANAIRRILIAEVPTMAIEKVYIMNNTSIIHDDTFAHRLGLVPIKADPRCFENKHRTAIPLFLYESNPRDAARPTADQEPNDDNTLVFTLNVKCTLNPHAPADATDPAVRFINSSGTWCSIYRNLMFDG